MDVAQSAAYIQSMTYEAGILEYEDFPRTSEPVWLLGSQYSALYDLDEIKHDILSRLWFTYRKGFSPIGGTGPTSDMGWGCMLRCGQMMLAEALIRLHIGRDWRWYHDKYHPKHHEILRMFLDKKASCYSIHQIASMGVSEGKAISEWFGPNTIAQVLKKLSVYDEWSNLQIHVALDNTVVINDIRAICHEVCKECSSDTRKACVPASVRKHGGRRKQSTPAAHTTVRSQPQKTHGASCHNGVDIKQNTCNKCRWKPLLLAIPLRLGLSQINCLYNSALKVCLSLKQSVGIIGGKPNHAHWFIGYVGDEMIYLDPHTVQNYVDITVPRQTDASYHCPYSCRMKVNELDPSLAVGFFCASEADFDDLCHSIQKHLIASQDVQMFELLRDRPLHWGALQASSTQGASESADFTFLEDRCYDTDDEFELL